MDLRIAASGLQLPTTTTNAAAMSSSSSSQIVASMFSPLSSRNRAYRTERRSPFLGGTQRSGMLHRSRSLEVLNDDSWRNKGLPLRRAVSASFDTFAEDEDEFVKKLQELVLGGQQGGKAGFNLDLPFGNKESDRTGAGSKSELHMGDQPWQVKRMGAPDWTDRDLIAIPSSMERIANSVDLPVSLRIIKNKKKKKKKNNSQQAEQWGDGFREAGECAWSSVQKAFSSMVSMITELHCYSLEMRQSLFYEDVKGVLERVQHEMHASFVWLFQQIFSGTPTLMVSVMLLLANFTVYSMSNTVAIAAPLPPPQTSVMSVTDSAYDHNTQPWFDQMSSNFGRTASVGGSGSGGGKVWPVTGATDDGPSSSYISNGIISEGVSTSQEAEEEVAAWNEIVEEACQMQADVKDESLMDVDILKWMIAPITVQIEADGASDYVETELRYYQSIQEDPQNPLLLSNFAQFLHTVLNDHGRAEEYYKKAAGIEPADAEALNRYATFLWLAKDDISAAEETYLQAIEADPGNTYYAANYAHFLWNTGGDDTCFPLDC